MKRPHRSFHRLIWLLLAPAIAAALWAALALRPTEPVNDAIPPTLEEGVT